MKTKIFLLHIVFLISSAAVLAQKCNCIVTHYSNFASNEKGNIYWCNQSTKTLMVNYYQKGNSILQNVVLFTEKGLEIKSPSPSWNLNFNSYAEFPQKEFTFGNQQAVYAKFSGLNEEVEVWFLKERPFAGKTYWALLGEVGQQIVAKYPTQFPAAVQIKDKNGNVIYQHVATGYQELNIEHQFEYQNQ